MIRLVTLLTKAGKAGLVPIQKQVTKKGKTFTQTFYMKPGDVTPASKPATNDQWLGPLGDERLYIRSGADRAVRIPEEVIAKRFTWNGINFVIHRSYDSENRFTEKDDWTVTEVSTGVRASAHGTVEGAESLALQALESRGPEEMMNTLKRFMPISATDSLDFEENPTLANDKPASDDDYYDLAERVFVSVVGEDLDPEDEHQQDRLADIRQWLKRRYTTSEEVESVLDDISSDDWHALELAVEFDIVIDDARELSEDLADISNLSDKDMDTVLDWYRSNYSEGDMIPERVNNLGASSDYGNDLDAEWVANYALENGVTLEWAQEAANEAVGEMDSESRDHLVDEITDSYGNDWDTSELEAMVSWMGGGTKYYREEGRLLDEQIRAGNLEEARRIMNRDTMLSAFTERAFDIPLDAVYRGTPNAVWATVNPGDKFPHSYSSFSKSREFALGFHSANQTADDDTPIEHTYDKFLIVMEKPDDGYIQGIDIHDIGENLRDNGTPNGTFDNFENELEVLVRAPSIEVIRTEDVSEYGRSVRVVYVKPVEMELLELMKSKFTSIADLVWASFNEPLAEPHENLSKAREGLIPVKRQVTKKGKTFSQTFYVKPDSVPKEPRKPTAVDALGSGGPYAREHYNKPDGFYIQFNLGGGESKAYRIPEKHIYGTHTYAGFNLVIHRVLSPAPELTFQARYRISELSTGLGLGVDFEDPKEAIRLAEAKIDKLTPGGVAKTVNSARKISYYTYDENIVSDTDDFPAVEPNRPTTEEDYTKTAIRIFNNSGMDEYSESKEIILTVEDIEDWLKGKDIDASTTDELIEVEKFARDPHILRAAIYEGLSYEEAEERQGYIDHLTNLIYESTKFSDAIDAFGPEDVESWGRRRSDNLLSDPLIYDISVGSDLDPDIEWNAADIMAYAIMNDMTVAQVQEIALDDIKASEDEMDAQGLVDVGGGSWKLSDLSALGLWVSGKVESNRTDAKAMFYRRETGGDESAYEPLVEAIERHSTPVEGVLYRGTRNKDWLDAEVGDIVPVGIASFSRSESSAEDFSMQNPSRGPCILILDPDDATESDLPVGVSVTDIVDAGRASGIGATLSSLKVDKYYFERETIVMAPAVEILAIDLDSGRVRVRPAKMNLVRFTKSNSDSDFIARLEKTFDEPLHREAEESEEDSGELL